MLSIPIVFIPFYKIVVKRLICSLGLLVAVLFYFATAKQSQVYIWRIKP
nr:MAG TPA: hypothetical protein [Caudoviricetes sp.]